MISTRWLDQRAPHWRRLEALLDRAPGGRLRGLNRGELQELGLLYRQIAADLATVREDPSAVRHAAFLNQLLTRAHHTIYSAERPSASAVFEFLRRGFPRAFRRTAGYHATACLLFLSAAGVGAALSLQDPELKARVIGPQMIETIARREMWTHSIVAIKPLASSAIMTNNLSVAFTAFAAGITGGVGTAYMMMLNGFMLGVIGMACAVGGMSLQLWSFVAPHGVLELPAIIIAGGAGLKLAQGLLFPGLLPRRDALVRAGKEALRLILGCIPLLVIAGIIEAFVSPTGLENTMKFALAAALFVLLALYLLTAGRLTPARAA